jgi:hypothetical protein
MRVMQKTEIKKSVTYRFGDKREVLKKQKTRKCHNSSAKRHNYGTTRFFEIKLKTVIDV